MGARGLEHSNHHHKEHGTGHGHFHVSHEDLKIPPGPPQQHPFEQAPGYLQPTPPTSPPPAP